MLDTTATAYMNPQVSKTYFQERSGVLKVAALLNEAGLVFRETPNADVGIDGFVELVDEDSGATGATVAVQIKSGTSYLRGAGAHWNYYPADKHPSYWEMYPLPMLLMLHDPTDDTVYWADVRLQLRSPGGKRSPLVVPKDSTLSRQFAKDLFLSCGHTGVGMLPMPEVLRTMAQSVNRNACFHLSFLDLFLEGLTDIGRKVFFSVGMSWDLSELKMADDAPTGVGMSRSEQNFLDAYIRFLVEQSLAHIDYSDVLIDLQDRDMFPTILAPLTSRGAKLRDHCRAVGTCGNRYEITEALVGLVDRVTNVTRALANFAVAAKVQAHFSAE